MGDVSEDGDHLSFFRFDLEGSVGRTKKGELEGRVNQGADSCTR